MRVFADSSQANTESWLWYWEKAHKLEHVQVAPWGKQTEGSLFGLGDDFLGLTAKAKATK